jgi:hypothetical protein
MDSRVTNHFFILLLSPLLKYSLSLILLPLPVLISAQDTINADLFFKLASVKSYYPEVNAKDIKFPLIESYEFRTETDEFNFERQEYLFRVSPSTKKKREAQKDIYSHLVNRPDFRAEENRCDLLIEMHLDWLDLHYNHKKLAIAEDLEVIYIDRKKILEQKIQTLEYNTNHVIDYEVESNKLALEKFDLRNDLDHLNRKYGLTDPVFSFHGFISVSDLRIFQDGDSLYYTPDAHEDVYDLEMIEKELNLEEAEIRQYFDFAQLRYQGPHADPFRERLSITAAFKLPNAGNQKLKIEELILEKKRLQAKMHLDRETLENELRARKLDLERDIAYFNFYVEIMNKEAAYLDDLGEQLKLRSDLNPMDFLEIQERKLKNDLEMLKLSNDIIERYLKLYYESGAMCAAPDRNWLSK